MSDDVSTSEKVRKVVKLGPVLNHQTQHDIFNLLMMNAHDKQIEADQDSPCHSSHPPDPEVPTYISVDGQNHPSVDLNKLASLDPEVLDRIYRIVCSFENLMNEPAD